MFLSKSIKLFLFSLLLAGSVSAQAQTNFLKARHEQALSMAQGMAKNAQGNDDKAALLDIQASALDSLGQSAQALKLADQALGLASAEQKESSIVTKSAILFSLGRAREALLLLTPVLNGARQAAATVPAAERAATLAGYLPGFTVAVFASVELENWKDALAYLADAESPPEDPDFYPYRSLLYRYIMARANDVALANPALEKRAADDAQNKQSHYGALLRMWQGDDTAPEIARLLAEKSGDEQQDAFAESLFYTGAYARYVKHDSVSARRSLQKLNQLAPYGSVEWVHARRVLN
ncbi:hypothetical protein [Janthinobacterium agaricidamnosum]|uniref:Uncharacterized domain protein n=1 Tax=Janthinobacterium agaricidamnosum NBRC 102515 = DSM 9628 TaxID=1349767 RepID=W0VBV8_9BURK|nr:hypothetical protein [Janthinobacterium agaricidamnosum]CDG85115.1 putative uncharacterized domain protein [Janthinobacterium agaricidamnosum NBRC 102515 = DSM 9628]